MAEFIEIEVYRYNPETDEEPVWKKYFIPGGKKNTVLGALQYIQEKLDSTLAFRYSCRYGRCGLCAVMVNGRPALACSTYLQEDVKIAPLPGLPLLKDLVIDRRSLFEQLRSYSIYPDTKDENQEDLLVPIKEPEEGALLRSCLECFACLSSCSRYTFGNTDFAGPYFFVKLAQLHLDPRDKGDRPQQAQDMGIKQCLQCTKKCHCIAGINIHKTAITPLLS